MLRCALAAALIAPCAALAQDFSAAITQRMPGAYAYTEAPAWSREGFFIWADVPEQKLWKLALGGMPAVYRESTNKAIGAVYDAKGDLFLCESATGRVVKIPAKGGPLEVIASAWQGKRLNSPNAVAIRKDGQIYFTDPAFGGANTKRELDFYGVYRIDPANKQEPLSVIARPKGRPNGIALSPDGRKLYVANSDEHALYVYDLSNKGEASNERVLIAKIPGIPGGVAVDEKGNIYIAARGVQIYSPDAKLLHTLEYAEQPSDVAFGGPDMNMLLVTAGTAVYFTELPVKGSVQY